MTGPATLFEKVWARHEVARREDGASLLWVDRHLVHEGSHHAFRALAKRGLSVAAPELTFAVTDHYAPTRGAPADATIAGMIETLAENARAHGLRHFALGDPRQGIVHVAAPEQGLTLPGLLVNCGDSHTSTHGAFGAIGFGIGATEVAHVLATQTIWQARPKVMRLRIDGAPAPGVGAKDMALNWIARLGADGARGHAVEYAGAAVRALSMEGRMTLCNLSIEGGARCGMVAPDAATLDWLKGRPFAPKGAAWEAAVEDWSALPSDEDAAFDREVALDAAEIAPIVTWGVSPEDALPIDASVPDPDRATPEKAAEMRDALDYMGLTPGRPLAGVKVDRVFIGSCTNG
ncbi:MAG: aconitase family protein, partial [Pseudomonadota bacterium]